MGSKRSIWRYRRQASCSRFPKHCDSNKLQEDFSLVVVYSTHTADYSGRSPGKNSSALIFYLEGQADLAHRLIRGVTWVGLQGV